MAELIQYKPKHKKETLARMADFFGLHRAMYDGNTAKAVPTRETRKTLKRWTAKDNSLYMIVEADVCIGFLHIGWRGGNVVWLEDIYVDQKHRGKGLAAQAVACAEKIIAEDKAYNAVCVDVSPRNADSLRLCARLGYTSLGMVTLRKELYENKMDKETELLGFRLTY